MYSAKEKDSRRPGYIVLGLLLAAITALAVLVRLPGLQREFWLDELGTAWVVRDGFGPLVERAWVANLSPAYFLVVRAFVDIFGYTEAAMRAPSILAGALLAPTVFFLARKMSGNLLLAAVASLLAAVDQTLIAFSLEVRPYALLQLVGALQVYAFLVLTDCPSPNAGRWRVAAALCFVVLTALGFYLHYTFLLILGPEALFTVLFVMTEKPLRMRRLGEFIGWLTLSGMLCLPAVGHLGYLLSGRGTLGTSPVAVTPEIAFTRFRTIPYVLLPLIVAWIVQWVSDRRGIAAFPNPAAEKSRRYSVFAVLWFLLPSAFVWCVAETGILKINLHRYVVVSEIAPLLIAVTLCPLFSSRAARAGFVLLMLAWVPGTYLAAEIRGTLPDYRQAPTWKAAVSFVNRECADARPVFVRPGLVEEHWLGDRRDAPLQQFLLCPVNSLYPITSASQGRTIEPVHCLAVPPSQTDKVIQQGGFVFVGQLGSEETVLEAGRKAVRKLGQEPSQAKIIVRSFDRAVVLSVFLPHPHKP